MAVADPLLWARAFTVSKSLEVLAVQFGAIIMHIFATSVVAQQ
jgi:hypothetical protein|tara:strand:- start:1445 stop:1573 length:129 start_codon:yes stop_codon:yes gene_type:complete